MVRVAVAGNINVDHVVRVDKFPATGETKVAGDVSILPGGKGANQAVSAARLGAKVSLIGRVGDDPDGCLAIDNLDRNGVDSTFVKWTPGARTGTAYVIVRSDGANMIVSSPGANMEVTPEDVEGASEAIRHCDILLVQLGIPMEAVERAIAIAVDFQKDVFLDPTPYRGVLPSSLDRITFISPNEVELRLITGEESSEAGLTKLHRMGAETIIEKAGSSGCVISTPDGIEAVEAFRDVKVVDTTGAGDTFSAAFSVSWAGGASVREAAVFANIAGAISTTKAGAQQAMPRSEEVLGILRKVYI